MSKASSTASAIITALFNRQRAEISAALQLWGSAATLPPAFARRELAASTRLPGFKALRQALNFAREQFKDHARQIAAASATKLQNQGRRARLKSS